MNVRGEHMVLLVAIYLNWTRMQLWDLMACGSMDPVPRNTICGYVTPKPGQKSYWWYKLSLYIHTIKSQLLSLENCLLRSNLKSWIFYEFLSFYFLHLQLFSTQISIILFLLHHYEGLCLFASIQIAILLFTVAVFLYNQLEISNAIQVLNKECV